MANEPVNIEIPERVVKAIQECIEYGVQPSRLTAMQVIEAMGGTDMPPYLISCYVKAWKKQNKRVSKLKALLDASVAAACYLDELGLHHSRDVLENLLEALKAYDVEPEFKIGVADEEF